MAENNILTQVEERLSDWDHRARLWYRLYYAFGGLAVVLTITVAGRPGFIAEASWLSAVAWLAALFQGISTFLVALPKAAAYRAAWRALWLARLEYVESPLSDDSRTLLLQAIGRGWTMIDGGYADAFRTTAHNIPPSLGRRPRPREPQQKS